MPGISRRIKMFQEYDVVVLKAPTSMIPLPAGTTGTVLIVHNVEPPAYVVESSNGSDRPLGIFPATDHDLLPWKRPQEEDR
jgi:hypothetical protein